MLNPRLMHSGNMQGSPKRTVRRDAPRKAVRTRVHVPQTTVLLAVSSTAQNKGRPKVFPQSSQGRETVPAAGERRKGGETSIPTASAVGLGCAEGMQ